MRTRQACAPLLPARRMAAGQAPDSSPRSFPCGNFLLSQAGPSRSFPGTLEPTPPTLSTLRFPVGCLSCTGLGVGAWVGTSPRAHSCAFHSGAAAWTGAQSRQASSPAPSGTRGLHPLLCPHFLFLSLRLSGGRALGFLPAPGLAAGQAGERPGPWGGAQTLQRVGRAVRGQKTRRGAAGGARGGGAAGG